MIHDYIRYLISIPYTLRSECNRYEVYQGTYYEVSLRKGTYLRVRSSDEEVLVSAVQTHYRKNIGTPHEVMYLYDWAPDSVLEILDDARALCVELSS